MSSWSQVQDESLQISYYFKRKVLLNSRWEVLCVPGLMSCLPSSLVSLPNVTDTNVPLPISISTMMAAEYYKINSVPKHYKRNRRKRSTQLQPISNNPISYGHGIAGEQAKISACSGCILQNKKYQRQLNLRFSFLFALYGAISLLVFRLLSPLFSSSLMSQIGELKANRGDPDKQT